ncbi:ASCH domain-containing protein [Streptomyces antimycoticus]|uniref:ASCH domain-containing protein n=1 Tax=Streptomyces antimycoticus TaxID=68175 RepID=UPI0036CF1C97
MHALTVRQPWADAIAYGGKTTENRTWPVPEKHIGKPILIHAGASYDPMGRFLITDWDALDSWPNSRSAIVAVASLTDCHRSAGTCCAPWGESDVYHWQLADVRRLRHPVPARGALGFWTPNQAVIEDVITQTTALRPSA